MIELLTNQIMTLPVVILRVVLAAFCGGILGAERLVRGRAAGIRTHALLCMGSALTVVIGMAAYEMYNGGTDPLRVAAQVVSGVSFLGVGTILLRGRSEIQGLTTAAGLWTTAAIGLALGLGLYLVGIVTTAIAFFLIFFVSKAEHNIKKNRRSHMVYLEVDDVRHADNIIQRIKDTYAVSRLDVTAPRSSVGGNVGIEVEFSSSGERTPSEVRSELKNMDEHILLVLKSI